MEFRILGPLELAGNGPSPKLGGPKERALLAFLLLHANEVVSRDRLIEALWGETAPSSAGHAIEVYVSRLRKALGPPERAAAQLQTRAAGYVLQLAPDLLDVDRFERLRAEGRKALDEGNAAVAGAKLREALALWRGPALADFAYEPFAQDEIARLDELRLSTIEDRVEADLSLGRHAELVAELEVLVAEQPLRERRRGQLMLALYRTGRQADALAAYRDGRRTLLDELGLEPSPALRELEAAILRQDASLAVESAELRARRHLPAPTTALIGRTKEVADIVSLLRHQTPRLLTLTGAGGTGKTRLALQAASEVVDSFADGVFFVGLAPLSDPALVVPAIADALGVREGGESGVKETLEAQLRDRRLLLVLDNFEQVGEAAPIVTELLRAAAGVKALVTSRAALRLYGEHEYPVPPLAEDDAIELFAARAEAVSPEFERDGARPQALEVCRALDCLPLAVELAAARINELSLEEMGELLARRLELAGRGPRDVPERQQALRATIDWSFRLLPGEEQKLFARLAVFVGGCSVDEARSICDAELADLRALVGKSLVLQARLADVTRFGMLETIREYAAERLEASREAEAVRRRHAERFLAVAEEAARELDVGVNQAAWLERLALEHDNMRAALSWFAAAGEGERELRLAKALKNFWRVRGHLTEGRRWLEEALSRGDRTPSALRGDALTALGQLAHRQGAFEAAKAAWEESLHVYRELGDPTGIARSIGELGSVALGEEDFERAAALYEESAALFRSAGDKMRLATVLANLGAIASLQRNYVRGRRLTEEALALQRELGAKDDMVIALHNLARVAMHEGRYSDGAELLREALELAHELSYTEVMAYSLEGLAELAAAHGDAERAARLLAAGDALFELIGVPLAGDERESYERTVAQLQAQLGAPGFARARSEGRRLDVAEAVEDALAVARDISGDAKT